MARGHISAHLYRYSFFKTAINVALEDHGMSIANLAIGNRIAQLDGKGFKKEIDKLTSSKKVNHEENLKRYRKK